MKLKFLPTRKHFTYEIDGENINNIPLSEIQEGESFSLPEMAAVGIRKAERIDSELFVTLEQSCIAYYYPVQSHDWRESDWLDADSTNIHTCHCKPISVEGKTDWEFQWIHEMETLPNGVQRPLIGWTVVRVKEGSSEA